MNQEIFKEVKNVIIENLGVEEERVIPEASLLDNLGADSLDLVELAMSLEDQYGITIDDSEISGLKTVADVVSYIEKNKK